MPPFHSVNLSIPRHFQGPGANDFGFQLRISLENLGAQVRAQQQAEGKTHNIDQAKDTCVGKTRANRNITKETVVLQIFGFDSETVKSTWLRFILWIAHTDVGNKTAPFSSAHL